MSAATETDNSSNLVMLIPNISLLGNNFVIVAIESSPATY